MNANDSGNGFIFDIDHLATDIENIKVPTLIMHSRNDGSVDFSHAEYSHLKIKNSELFEVNADSHFMYIGNTSE